ncbi:hypothetical protein EV360DRAFT_89937 [Lentinula raphanica]|nr:hypothetical protein EV360DRAFT_89937 [Lentinula raphanica]
MSTTLAVLVSTLSVGRVAAGIINAEWVVTSAPSNVKNEVKYGETHQEQLEQGSNSGDEVGSFNFKDVSVKDIHPGNAASGPT